MRRLRLFHGAVLRTRVVVVSHPLKSDASCHSSSGDRDATRDANVGWLKPSSLLKEVRGNPREEKSGQEITARARHLRPAGRAGRGNGPLAALVWGNQRAIVRWSLCPAFSACFHLPGDNAPASHLLLTSMPFPADFPICLSSLVVKDLTGSSACSASALVTGSVLSARDE